MNVLGFDLSVDNIVQHCLINQACEIYVVEPQIWNIVIMIGCLFLVVVQVHIWIFVIVLF